MAYLGKQFVLEKQEKFEEFVNSLAADAPEDYRKALIAHKSVLKLVKNGDSYTLYTSRPDNPNIEITFKLGEEISETVNGRPATSVFTLDGNTLTHVQKFGDGAFLTFKRTFSDNAVVAETTSSKWDGVAIRYYKAA